MGNTIVAPENKNAFSKLKKFAYSDLYFILLAAIVVVGWSSKISALGFFALVIVSSVMLVVLDDILPLFANVFFAPLMLYSDNINDYLIVWPIFIPLVIAVIIFVITNFKNQRFKFGKMFIPQLLVSVALLIGGVGTVSKEGYLSAFPVAFVLGFGVLICYVIASHYLKVDEKRDYPLIFSKAMMYLGIAVSIQMIIALAQNTIPYSEWDVNALNLGWGNRNNAATILIITIPLTIYLSTRYRKSILYLLFASLQIFCLFMTISRGAIIVGLIEIVLALIIAVIKAPNRKLYLYSLLVGFIITLIAYLASMSEFNQIISATFKYLDWVDRKDLYSEAALLFKAHWFIGVGVGYIGTNYEIAALNFYYFHSTLFQVIACMGIVGVIAYVVYYVYRFGTLFRNIRNAYSLFTLVAWLGFEAFSMMDTGTFVPFPNMILIIVMTIIMEKASLPTNNTYADDYNCWSSNGGAMAYALAHNDIKYEYQER